MYIISVGAATEKTGKKQLSPFEGPFGAVFNSPTLPTIDYEDSPLLWRAYSSTSQRDDEMMWVYASQRRGFLRHWRGC